MSRGMPSLTALLGLVALAGYQNRDKLAEMLQGATGGGRSPAGAGQQGPLGGLDEHGERRFSALHGPIERIPLNGLSARLANQPQKFRTLQRLRNR